MKVTGLGGVPSTGVGAVVLNVTAVSPEASGYATVYPAGAARPTASNLNYESGQIVPNMVIAKVGVGGEVTIFSQQRAHFVVDVQGWYPAGSTYSALTPQRVLDTRQNSRVAAGSVRTVKVAGRAGVPSTGVGAVALNVTAVDPAVGGYATVYPSGASRPTASNLNYTAGQIVPNMVIAKVGENGEISIFSQQDSDFVVDVQGWYPTSSSHNAQNPTRVLDTRTSGGVVNSGSARRIKVTGTSGVPSSGVAAVVLNVTAVSPDAAGYATVYPSGTARPTASNLNYVAGQIVPNMVIAKVGTNGEVSLFSQQNSHYVVDVQGWYATSGAPTPTPTTPAVRSSVEVNQRLSTDESLTSPNGAYRLTMQSNGNLVLRKSSGEVVWTSGTEGKGASFAVPQSDGNFVIYRNSGGAIWESGTKDSAGRRLTLDNDGVARLRSPQGTVVWATNARYGLVKARTQAMSAPSLTSTLKRWYDPGSNLKLECHVRGQAVTGFYGGPSDLWYKVGDSYVPDIDMSTGSNNPVVGACSSDSPSSGYKLPWDAGKTYPVTQAPGESFSHQNEWNRTAVDFGLPSGTPVLASASGRVKQAGAVSGGAGVQILVDHGSDNCSQYIHLSRVVVAAGQQVKQGQLIGYSGATGAATGPHLHWAGVYCSSGRSKFVIKTDEAGTNYPRGARLTSTNTRR